MQWRAIYDDGTVLHESDGLSTEHIDRDRLEVFALLDGERVVFAAFFDKKRRLIFRRRTYLDAGGNVKGIVYLIGWHANINGTSVKSICYVYEDGHVEFDDARNDIELVPAEMI